jgi:hypothetical protein
VSIELLMPPNAILVGFAMAAKLALNRKTDFSKQLLIIDKLWGRTPEQPQSNLRATSEQPQSNPRATSEQPQSNLRVNQ